MAPALLSDNTVKSLAVFLGVSAGAAAAIYTYKRLQTRFKVPTNWTEIGEVTDLYCYPVKSCGAVKVKSIQCQQLGVQNGLLRDRVFVVVNSDTGKFVTGRQYPTLVLVEPKVDGSVLTLTAPKMPDLILDINKVLASADDRKTDVWGCILNVVDCGDEAAKWFSRYVLNSDEGLRLFYYPSNKPEKPVLKDDKKRWPKTTSPEHTGSMHDCTSYMIMNADSVADLNKRLDEPVTPRQFRPNVVFKGLPAYEEDKIQWFRIGEKTVFRYVQACLRCVFTTVNPDTAKKNTDLEPLKTLKSYRKVAKWGESPVLGVHLGVVVPDSIKVGDKIYAGK